MTEAQQIGKENNFDAVLEIKDLHTYFYTDAGKVKAVNGVSFSLERGKVLGIVGNRIRSLFGLQ